MATKGKRLTLLAVSAGVALVIVSAGVYWDDISIWYRLSRDFERLRTNEQRYREYRHRQTGIVMVRVPGGTFWMGSPESEAGRVDNEGPVHEVTLSPFLIAKYEVSQAEWKKIMGDNPSKLKGDALPVTMISWKDCQEFCEKTGLSFPTEAQWEYSCRAGTTTRFWSGGDDKDLDRVGWYGGNLGHRLHSVGEKLAGARNE